MTSAAARACALGGLLCLLAGCATAASIKYYQYPRNPLTGVSRVAVAPFQNEAGGDIDMLGFSETFASELVQFPGFTVVRPREVVERARAGGFTLPLTSDADAVKLAKALGVDAIVVGAITEYDPYYPPRVALAAQMVGVRRFSLRSIDVDRLVPSGKPFRIDAGRQDQVVAALEKVWDSNWDITRMELRGYTMAHAGDDNAYPEEDATLRVMERYWRFVANRMVRNLLDQGQERQQAAERAAQAEAQAEAERAKPEEASPRAGWSSGGGSAGSASGRPRRAVRGEYGSAD